jgi:hypothetical protein
MPRLKKTPTPKRTKTRAQVDAAVYDLYLWLHDGPRRNVSGHLKVRHKIGFELIDDLRECYAITSTGYGKNQKHAWTGEPPTPTLCDRVEKLRAARAARAAERREARAIRPTAPAPETVVAVVEVPETNTERDPVLQIDRLLDMRNDIDRTRARLDQTRQQIDRALDRLKNPEFWDRPL